MIQRWGANPIGVQSPEGMAGRMVLFCRPFGTYGVLRSTPSVKRLGYGHPSLRDVPTIYQMLGHAPDGKMPSSTAGETPPVTG